MLGGMAKSAWEGGKRQKMCRYTLWRLSTHVDMIELFETCWHLINT